MEWAPLVPELSVADYEASRGFYVGILGFSVVFERERPRFAYLDLAGAQLMLEEDHEDAWLAGPLAAPRGRGMNLQIEVAGVVAIRERAAASGIRPFRDVSEHWYETAAGEEGQRELILPDPDGYLIRVVEVLAAAG